MNDFNSSVERIIQAYTSGMLEGTAKGIKFVQGAAKLLCTVGDGELRQSIFTMMEEREGTVLGVCYTNKAHAAYVEFGTGPRGQQNHAGISPEVTPAYTQSPWWIHESMIDEKTAKKYKFFSIQTKDGIFYQSTGQPAQPFMYPSLKNNEDYVSKIITDEIANRVRKAGID